jgi:hypothetical protein
MDLDDIPDYNCSNTMCENPDCNCDPCDCTYDKPCVCCEEDVVPI